MNFTDKSFVIFILVVYGLWLFCRRNQRAAALLFLVASLYFYGCAQWELIFLILGYCVADWSCALWLVRSRRPGWVLGLGVGANLFVLAYWKYTPLLVRTAANLAFALDLPLDVAVPHDWLLPWGISFYAFTGIAYLVDVYRREAEPERNLLRFTLFITFFPQLVAGPILRARDFLRDLQPESFPDRPQALLDAALLLGLGFFKKLVLADRIALAIDPFFSHVTDSTTAGVWSLPYVWLYALQIFFDFSAYTDIARGLGLLFGFRWPENFNLPYLAVSVADFWKRWHMTLSQFLRDYLYIPLGGNRHGAVRTSLNLMATMLLGGLWHGASWSFLLWGGLHGTFLIVHRLWTTTSLRASLAALTGFPALAYRAFAMVLTFHAVCLAWCFFRLTELPASWACVRKWLLFDADKMWVGNVADASLWVLLLAYGGIAYLAHRLRRAVIEGEPGALPEYRPLGTGFTWGYGAALVFLAVLLAPGGEKPAFIYFQF